MSDPSPSSSATGGAAADHGDPNNPPTIAAFSPSTHGFSTQQRSTILVHQKSPLLLATPPQVTRALAYSHPFIVPLNQLVGLLSWTTGDPWESFLLVASFWFVVLYGDYVLRYAGPLLLVTMLIFGMYLRRYSPLSSTGWTGEKQPRGHKRDPSQSEIKHRKSLDEILATLQTFTTRSNILLDPLLRLTDFLSTQQTATSATTRPALTTLFIRILLASPIWFILTLWPLEVITTKRIVLVSGTLVMTWHSRPARISRTILWRSRTVRWLSATTTGLNFAPPSTLPPKLPPRNGNAAMPGTTTVTSASRKPSMGDEEGIRFTFSVFENQRRWLGIGWTASMLAYERAPWTDEHLNPVADIEHFSLPDVEGGMARWRWAEGSEWCVEGGAGRGAAAGVEGTDEKKGHRKRGSDGGAGSGAGKTEDVGWIYYDNKWHDGRRGQDGWGRYTRRRKWVRDAELVDVLPTVHSSDTSPDANKTPAVTAAAAEAAKLSPSPQQHDGTWSTATETSPGAAERAERKRKSWFGKQQTRQNQTKDGNGNGKRDRGNSAGSTSGSVESGSLSRAAMHEDDLPTPPVRLRSSEAEWGLGDDVSMELG
ncbi:hypothetical protein M8818_007709 [Zalaria obscura]|uniref:Uncharacterized protein n=1 Tax=Zalaria obscura TaxID=2024903 RepID=A0ACC3S2I9_9PEZI